MSFYNYNTAKLTNLLFTLLFFLFFNGSCSIINKIKNKKTKNDNPIAEIVEKKKRKEKGVNYTDKELKKLERIQKKYSLSEKQKSLRKRQPRSYNPNDELIEYVKQSNGYSPVAIKKKKDDAVPTPVKAKKNRGGLIDNFILMRSYRKDYLRKKKLEKFKIDRLLNMQTPKTRERMKERQKKIKKREKYRKRKKRRNYIKSLFK